MIGDPVNEAARLSELAKHRSERVLAAEASLHRAGGGSRGVERHGRRGAARPRDAERLAQPRSGS